jgi:hypothetical protein
MSLPLDTLIFRQHKTIELLQHMKKTYILVILVMAFVGCKKDNSSSNTGSLYSIIGVAQKGPFLQGSKVTVYELNNNFEQIGKVFTTETSDDFGSFSLKDMLLTSSIVQVEVQGYPYDEIISGINEEMSLSNIVDLKAGTSINVNLLSDLSRQRFKYLVQNGGAFDVSKLQAEKEVMKAFGLDSFYLNSSEKMDITKSDDASSSLLALSAILLTAKYQQPGAQTQQFVAKCRSDFENEGILSDSTFITLIKAAFYQIDPESIRKSLSSYYKEEVASFSNFVNIAKRNFFNIHPDPPYNGPPDVILTDVAGNLLRLPKDSNYLPLFDYQIAFAFPAQVYKKVRLTISFTGDFMDWYVNTNNGYIEWEYLPGDESHWAGELKGVGLVQNFTLQNLTTNPFYLLFEDITESPSKIISKKWIWFNYH